MTAATNLPTIKYLVQSLFAELKANGWAVQRVDQVLNSKPGIDVTSTEQAVQLVMNSDLAAVGFTKEGDWVHTIHFTSCVNEDLKGVICDWTKQDGQGFDSLVYDFIESIPSRSLERVPDQSLDAEQLRTKYVGQGQHPQHLKAAWKYEVESDNTIRGYWDWVEASIEAESDPCASNVPPAQMATVHSIFESR